MDNQSNQSLTNQSNNNEKRRGIQLGQVATDKDAAKLDNQCKTSITKVYEALKEKYKGDIQFQKKLAKDQIPGGVGACAPDGSLWFWKGTLIAAFEAKKQQNRGNAIERWHKNHALCRMINPKVSYVTFACGEGAVVGGVIHKAIAFQHLDGFDKYVPGKNSCWMKPDGFKDEEIENIMVQVIEERITSLSE
jgi:hypothetical protein